MTEPNFHQIPILLDPKGNKSFLKAIWVGRPGGGKTVAYYGAPRPLIVGDVDTKIETIKWLYGKTAKMVVRDNYSDVDLEDPRLQYIPIDIRDFPSMYNLFNNIIASPPVTEKHTGTFIMDSLTSIADNTLDYSLAQRGSTGKSTGIIPIPDLPEWMSESMFLSSLFSNAKSMKCHVILTAHMTITSREVMASKAERSKGAPASYTRETKQLITGGSKIAAKIPVYFSEVWNFQQIPNPQHGASPIHLVYTKVTDECDIGRTKFRWPYEINITYPDYPPTHLWDVLREAMNEVVEWEEEENEDTK